MPRARQEPPSFRFLPIGKPSEIAWGQLVAGWILEQVRRPANLKELIDQCDERNIFYDHPDNLSQDIYFLQKGPGEMTIRLPAKALFEEGQRRIREGTSTYKFPEFYDDFFTRVDMAQLDTATALKLHSARTGEYAINGCA